MTHHDSHTRAPLRLWPGLVAAGLMLPLRVLVPIAWPDGMIYAVFGAIACGLAVLLWWTFFSRAPRVDRWFGLAISVAALAAV